MKRLLVLASLAAAIAAPLSVSAGDSGSNALAVELSRLVLPETTWNAMEAGIAQQMKQRIDATFQQQGITAPAEFSSRLAEEVQKILSYRELVDIQAGLLVKYYSEAELKELLAFYRTPIGQKSIRIMPEVLQDVNGQIMALLSERMPAMMERLRPVIEQMAPPAAKEPAATPKAKSKRGK